MSEHLYKQVILDHQLLRGQVEETCTVQDVIAKLSYVQIDSLNIVNRAHHHSLYNRIKNYDFNDLSKLIDEKKIFEYWFHAASYLPICDYKFALVQMNSIKNNENHYSKNVEKKDVFYVLDKIKNEGPLKSRDFKENSKPSKNALEKLFLEGELVITQRNGIEKVYDLKTRVLPQIVDTKEATLREYALYLIQSAIQAHGLASLGQMLHLRRGTLLKRNKKICFI